ncbi:MAG: phosphoglucosamine mutase [Flavobacteriales bacterium]|nr:phosphoglucosamine mutase [Flavobacteriales bacterium]MDW8410464.1 phosphoglucosamine mutase [Flavobacteriales bacterium]
MTLIKSISGIRGTIGGVEGHNLTPPDVVRFTCGYAHWLRERFPSELPTVVLGRDGRVSGEMVVGLVAHALMGCGIRVINLGYSTTPTVEMAVSGLGAQGGIVVTASHNPVEWNALKLLNERGEFLSAQDGERVLELALDRWLHYPSWDALGSIQSYEGGYLKEHVQAIIAHPLVDAKAVAQRGFRVVVDAINSTGGLAVPLLLEALGVKDYLILNKEPMGRFAHHPEPLAEHLSETCLAVRESGAHLGIVVDPDVDRLAFIQEDGQMFGEEYTLVAVARYYLKHRPGPVVNNLSSSRALSDVAGTLGCPTYSAAVGEAHVVAKMKEVGAVLGGEGNGGVIVPDLHYGRDALAGIALFLTALAHDPKPLSELRSELPSYELVKKKITLAEGVDTAVLLRRLAEYYPKERVDTTDGVKVNFERGWVHVRRSNTEPIVRIYAEAPSAPEAEELAADCLREIQKILEDALSL